MPFESCLIKELLQVFDSDNVRYGTVVQITFLSLAIGLIAGTVAVSVGSDLTLIKPQAVSVLALAGIDTGVGSGKAYDIAWLKTGVLGFLIYTNDPDLASKTLAQPSAAFYVEGLALADGTIFLETPGYI